MTQEKTRNQSKNHHYYRCDKERFATFDLGLAASLASLDYEIIDLDKQNPRKVKFIFSRSPDLNKAVKGYFSGKLMVSARSMFENIKMLKNRIYSTL